ncbi:MAG: response regulator transcription factor [Planctomycetes bacterium]|nr:response regulator transcription factor [Planctomycetota bacterium]MCB9910232.1 response regulator transcription factor [Planctomycetota bacterium]HPF12839.1 response regulator transcription factor [Planctomycetota bacterium]HRV81454.1 response regulator transcription factor [Planctomycetota bacterium]
MSAAARILVVDDEETLAAGIAENLTAEGYEPKVVGDGLRALECLRSEVFDLVLLDVMMPGLDGLAVCKTLREEGNQVPILFLTARGSTEDRIRGLESGGDDYLAKPFALRELLLRVQIILRRVHWYRGDAAESDAQRPLAFGGNEFSYRTYSGSSWDGHEQHLPHKEAMILKTLADRNGEVVSREFILEQVWGYEAYPSTRTIDNFIVRLRKRFEREPDRPRHIHTVRGVGYRFTTEPEDLS